MAITSTWFKEVGGFTLYLLLIIGTGYAVTYGIVLREYVKHWRANR